MLDAKDDFGAIGDGVANDTTALQAAVTAWSALGGVLHIPRGRYRITNTLVATEASADDDDLMHLSLIGEGGGASQFLNEAGAPALRYIGATLPHSYLRFDGFRVRGTGLTGQHGLQLDNAAFFSSEDVSIGGCDRAIVGTDILSGRFDSLFIRGNRAGADLSHSNFSRPNSLTFEDCNFGLNTDYAAMIQEGALVRFLGGAIEGNGSNESATFRGGIKINNAGTEGKVGLFAQGVYFEGNRGHADIFIDSELNGAMHMIGGGCTFNRISAANHVLSNIKLNCADGLPIVVHVKGNGFGRFNDYVPNAARPYIDVSGAIGAAWAVKIDSEFQDVLEMLAASAQVLYAAYGAAGGGRSQLGGQSGTGTIGPAQVKFLCYGINAFEYNVYGVAPYAGFIDDFEVYTGDTPGAGQSYTFVLRKNLADTSMTAVVDHPVGGPPSNHGVSSGLPVFFNKGDRYCLKVTGSAGAQTVGQITWGATFRAA